MRLGFIYLCHEIRTIKITYEPEKLSLFINTRHIITSQQDRVCVQDLQLTYFDGFYIYGEYSFFSLEVLRKERKATHVAVSSSFCYVD